MRLTTRLITLLIPVLALATTARATYVGAAVGYLIDSEDEIITAHVGFPIFATGTLTHNIEAEVGYLEDSDVGASIDMTPVMLNYVLKTNVGDGLGFYFGGGIGYSFYDLDFMGYGYSGEILTWQALVGIQYAFSQSVSLKAGYRYFLLDDIEDTGVDFDDSILEVGVIFSF